MAQQNLAGLHSGVRAMLTPGNSMSRMMNQYAKGHDFMNAAANAGLTASPPRGKTGVPVRGGKGGIKTNPKFGGFSAGANGGYGKPSIYGTSGDNS